MLDSLIIEQLEDDGTLRTFIMRPPNNADQIIVAFAYEYEEPHDGPFHFLEVDDESFYRNSFAKCRSRRLGGALFQKKDSQIFVKSLRWKGIRTNGPSLTYYALSLPEYAIPIRLSISDTDKPGREYRREIIRDNHRHRYVIYLECTSSSGEFNFVLESELEINREKFPSSSYIDKNTYKGNHVPDYLKSYLPPREVDKVNLYFNRCKAVIVTALPLEFDAVCSYLCKSEEVEHPQGTIYTKGQYVGNKNTWDVLVAEVGKNNPIASQETERAIAFHKPSVALFIGVSGGVKDVRLGDVVAADKVYYYESGKWDEGQNGEAEFHPRPMVYNSGYRLVEQAKSLARKDEWQKLLDLDDLEPRPSAIVGPLAAGESVVVSKASEVYTLIKKTYGDSIALAMEDFGFLRAVYANPDVQALVIRGISDLIEKKSEADSKGWQDVAARRASAFAFAVLSKASCEPLPEEASITHDLRGQTVNTPQTNINGGVEGSVLSGTFSGPVNIRPAYERR